MRRVGIGLLAAVALLVAAQPVLAAPQWLPPVPAFSAANAPPYVAMGPDGTLAIAYAVPLTGEDPLISKGDVQVRIRPPGGEFGPPTTLASDAAVADLAVGRGGHVAIMWRSGSGHYVALRSPGGMFGPAHEITPDGTFAAIRDLAVAPDGRAWMLRGPFGSDVVTLGPDGGVTTFPLDASSFDNLAPPSLAVDGTGHVTVVYAHATFTPGVRDEDPCWYDYELRIAEGDAGGISDVATLAQTRLQGTTYGSNCQKDGVEPVASGVIVRPNGEALVTYGLNVRADGRAVETRVVARHRPAGGAWPSAASTPEPIAVQSYGATAVPAFAGATPLVLLEDSVLRDISLSARNGDGSWSPPQLLSGNAMQAAIAGSPAGNALIAYIDLLTARATGVVRTPGGVLYTPTPVSAPFNGWIPLIASLSVTVDDDGNGAVASGEPNHQPWLAPYDGAGPRMTANFPAGGGVGQPLPFAATALDVWSGATLDWSFGDEAKATGPTATHAYREPGVFIATVTAVDTFGNESTRSGAVTIPDVSAPRFRGRASVRPRRLHRGHVARLSFDLSEPATVRVTATARLSGVRRGRRCVVASRRARAGVGAVVRCNRTVQRTLRSKRLALSGFHELALPTRGLKRARYTLRLTAQDAAGNRSRTVTLTLVVLARRE